MTEQSQPDNEIGLKENQDLLDDDSDLNDFGFDDFGDMGGTAPIDKHSDLLKDLTDFDPSIQKRVRNWLGLEWDEESKTYIEKNEPIINLKGAKWAIGFLTTYLTKTNIITNISEQEYKDLRIDIIDTAWVVFQTYDEFSVKNNGDWYRLSTELQHSAELVLMGAGDGKYTKFIGTATNRTESVNLTPHQNYQQPYKKPGMFSGFKNMFRRERR